MFVPMKVILDEAYAGRYGVPALPAFNEIQIRAGIEAAVQANSPVIFLTGNRGDPYFTHGIVKYFADQVDVDVALCLDHSRTFDDCVLGVRTGCSAIMADRSTESYDVNVAECKLLASIAHAAGVSIEAELGHVGQGSNYAVDGVSALTDPAEAKRFFADTGVDALAVAIGTAHGVYYGTPKLDFERLKDIDAACQRPLVLHGGSGSGEDNIHKACTMGIAKVNIVTDVLAATTKAAQEGDFSGNKGHAFYGELSKAIKEYEMHLFDVTGSTGKSKGTRRPGGSVGNDEKSTQEK
jgi:fructose-bisphosphate aldolase class II